MKKSDLYKSLDIQTIKKLNSYNKSLDFNLSKKEVEVLRLVKYLETLGIFIHEEKDIYGNILNIKVFYSKIKYLKDTNLNTLEAVLLMIFNELETKEKYAI